MSLRRLYTYLLFGVWGGLLFITATASFVCGERLDAVSVRFTGPGAEPKDATVLGIGKDRVLPDYRLEIVYGKRRVRGRTILDTSATAGIRFDFPEDLSLRRVQELVLIEEDKVNDDLVTAVPFSPPAMSSAGYAFEVEVSRSFSAGLDWLNHTASGNFVVVGLIISSILVFLWIVFKLRLDNAFGGNDVPGPDL